MSMTVSLWEESELIDDVLDVDLVHVMPSSKACEEERDDSEFISTFRINGDEDGNLRIKAQDSIYWKNRTISVDPISEQEIRIKITRGDFTPPKKGAES